MLNLKRAEPIQGARLRRLAKTWVEQGARMGLEAVAPSRLAKLYSDRAPCSPATKGDFKVVDEGEV